MKIKEYFKKLFAKHFYIGYLTLKSNPELYYSVMITCENCNNTFTLYVKKGLQVKDMLGYIKCNRCRCKVN